MIHVLLISFAAPLIGVFQQNICLVVGSGFVLIAATIIITAVEVFYDDSQD